MRRFLSGLASASLVFVVAACNRAAPPSVGSESANSSAVSDGDVESATRSEEFSVGRPIRHGNLTIFPVLSKLPRMEDRFITLDEGLKAGTVEVREKGVPARPQIEALGSRYSGETQEFVEYDPSRTARQDEPASFDEFGEQPEVNRVTVVNRSDKPLYLMPGEVIVGGLQDRTIAEETIIPATGEPVSIDVYCVEQGRWTSQQNSAAVALGGMIDESEDAEGAVEEVAAKGERGEFFAVPGLLNKSSRVAAQSMEGQSTVWYQVAKANSESGVSSESGAYTLNFLDGKGAKELQEYIDAVAGGVAGQERVVGVVVAINGKVESAEVFESTPLFLKLWPRLLRSFALDASHQAGSKDDGKECSSEDAQRFLASILEEQKSPLEGTQRGLIVSKRDTEGRISFSAQDASFGGMGGSPVHAAGFSK